MPSQRGDDGEGRTTTRQREQELRRSRGEISCAECRRLKLRCDKKVPCSSCTRRGCTTICPNGTLAGGQGTRFVLADTDKLHRKLNEMSERIRQLEDALQITYAGTSSNPHPLLTEELLAIKRGIDVPESRMDQDKGHDLLDKETLEAFGTLSLCEGGAAEKFLGLTTGEGETEQEQHTQASLLSNPPRPEIDVRGRLPKQIDLHASSWPFEPVDLSESELRAYIERNLPPWERATALCEAYLENLSWYYRAIERPQLMEELMPVVYKRKKPGVASEEPSNSSTSHPLAHVVDPCCGSALSFQQFLRKPQTPQTDGTDLHDLALILMVFAAGAAGDLTQNQYNEEAETYHHMARAALGLKSIFDGATLATVQATSLLGAYHVFSARRQNLETAWLLFNISFILAGSIGLHRDPARWGLEPKIVQRRRSLFWELLTINNWQSASSGRPTVFCLHSTDCEFPEDVDAALTPEGKIQAGYWRWKQRFTKEVLAPITERMCVSSPLKYSSILEMDRQIRDFQLEYSHTPKIDAAMGDWNYTEMMQYVTSSTFMEIVSLIIHRNFFAKAILDHPANPLRSPFAPSFLSAYRSATTILKTVREQYEKMPQLMIRLWPIWSHALSAAVVVASVVTRGPSSALAPSAFIELGLAVSLFEKAVIHPAVRQGLPVLIRLREKAQHAFYEQRTNQVPGVLPPLRPNVPTIISNSESEAPQNYEQRHSNDVSGPSSSSPSQSRSPLSSLTPSASSASPSAATLTSSSGSPRSSASPKSTSRRTSPKESMHHDFGLNIPQAVLNTQNSGNTFSLGDNDYNESMHPQLQLWTQQYTELAKSATSTTATSLATSFAPNNLTAHPSSLPQFWQGASITPTSGSSDSSGIFTSGMETAPTAVGLQNNLNDLLNHSYMGHFTGPDTLGGSQAQGSNIFDEMMSMQLPMDVGTDETWKMFVQDQGFQDPGLF